MKYIDEKRLRFGYLGMFAASVLLLVAAWWDATYNGEQLVTFFVSGLIAVLVLSVLFFVATESILKDALDLRPRRPVANGEGGADTPRPNQGPAYAGFQAVEPRLQAASLGFASRGAAESASSSGWQPHRQPAPTPRTSTIRIELPQPVEINAIDDGAARRVPAPSVAPSSLGGRSTERMPYEWGNPEFRVPRGTRSARSTSLSLESTRVLCGDCGVYFRVDLDHSRPQAVECPECEKELGLSGARLEAEHVRLRCRFCGDVLRLPRLAEHKATQCSTCGQLSA
jgi:hypothetical protein